MTREAATKILDRIILMMALVNDLKESDDGEAELLGIPKKEDGFSISGLYKIAEALEIEPTVGDLYGSYSEEYERIEIEYRGVKFHGIRPKKEEEA